MRAALNMHCDRIWRNARLATLTPGAGLGAVEDGVLACREGRIVFAGAREESPADLDARGVLDGGGRGPTPAWIAPPPPLFCAGDRPRGFELRRGGAS